MQLYVRPTVQLDRGRDLHAAAEALGCESSTRGHAEYGSMLGLYLIRPQKMLLFS